MNCELINNLRATQTSILRPMSCYGIGMHSGKDVQVTIKPALPDTGVVFVRSDMRSEINYVQVSYLNVIDTTLSTTIANKHDVQIATIEHFMAAIWGCGIDNIIVELDGPEVPIMDGSSKAFVFMLECAGKQVQNAPKKYLKILKEVRVADRDREIVVGPAESMHINLTIEFESTVIGKQQSLFSQTQSFKKHIADARTFGFVKDVQYLQSIGLAKGASLNNAIGVDKDRVLNPEGLRSSDEFVRHKLLDMIGDLCNADGHIIGKIHAYKTGHDLNHAIVQKICMDTNAYKWVTLQDL